ncbi:MAG TPA: hypothetical protein VGM26_18385 [Rhizomicrobium sp.]
MKLAAIAVFVALAATPALAQSTYPDSNTTVVTTPSNTTVVTRPAAPDSDAQIANKDAARQNYYQHKLDAANAQAQANSAQSQADQAAADRDAALDKAADDRADMHAANQ